MILLSPMCEMSVQGARFAHYIYFPDIYPYGNDLFQNRFRLDAGLSVVCEMFRGCFERCGYGLFGLVVKKIAFLIVR